MRDVAPSTGRPTLDKPRSRRDAAKVLAIALQTRYRKLLEATGEDEIVIATGDLAQCMYENVEFVIWALKSQGGMHPPPPEELRRITPPKPQGFVPPDEPDRLAEDMGAPVCVLCRKGPGHDENCPNAPKSNLLADCTCPPHDSRIIGYKHMTSCPKFVPA